jgi:glycosyltransferase involved in cell wall biosynthesis
MNLKLKVAIDVSPLQTGHKVRGVGFYLDNLKNSLVKYFPENEYFFFQRGEKLPNDIDIVHFPYFEPFFLALPIYNKFKTIVTVHDLTPIVFPKYFPRGLKGEIKWQMQKFSLRLAGVKESKVKVVYLAAGEQFKIINRQSPIVNSVRSKYGLPDKFVLYVGDVTPNKNLPRLLDSIKALKIPLVMVGKSLTNKDYDKSNPWNLDLNRVNELIKGDSNIMRLGFVPDDDLVTIYNLATVFAMPSFYEGFGLPILEAMSCGCPVVTTKEGSLDEVAGDSAYFVDAYNVESIQQGIKKVYFNENLQKELSKKGLENVKRFSWKKTAADTLKVYRQVLNS